VIFANIDDHGRWECRLVPRPYKSDQMARKIQAICSWIISARLFLAEYPWELLQPILLKRADKTLNCCVVWRRLNWVNLALERSASRRDPNSGSTQISIPLDSTAAVLIPSRC